MRSYLTVVATLALTAASRASEDVAATKEVLKDPQERGQRSIGGEEIGYHGYSGYSPSGYASGYASGYSLPAPQLISQHVEVEKHIPIVQYQGIPYPVPHQVPVPIPHPVPVPVQVPVQVPVHVPVYKTVTVPVEKPVPYPVEKPVPVEVIRKVHVPVHKPYPVPVPVYRTKHVFHEIIHSKHGW